MPHINDEDYFEQIASCELRRKHFSHEAHIRIAWIHIQRYGVEQAEQTIPKQLKKYITHIGMGYTFNQTISIASIRILKRLIKETGAKSFNDLVTSKPVILDNFKSLLEHHYGDWVYMDNDARASFQEPDINPFV